MNNLSDIFKNKTQPDTSVAVMTVDVYKDNKDFAVHISHDGSSGVTYHSVTTTEQVGNCVNDYVASNF